MMTEYHGCTTWKTANSIEADHVYLDLADHKYSCNQCSQSGNGLMIVEVGKRYDYPLADCDSCDVKLFEVDEYVPNYCI